MRYLLLICALLAGCLVEPRDTSSGETISAYNTQMLTFWGTVLTGVLLFLGQIVTMIMNSRNASKIDKVDEKVGSVDVKVEEVKKATDGMKTELVKVTNQKANLEGHAAGLLEGAQGEKERRQENGARPVAAPAAPAPIIVVVPAAVVAAPSAVPQEVGTVSASTEPDMSIKAKETKVDAKGATIIIDGGGENLK